MTKSTSRGYAPEKLAGYARVLAQARVTQAQKQRLFGEPYLTLGQCWAFGAYFFQLGGILGAKYAGRLDVFTAAFLGLQGQPGAADRFFTELAGAIRDEIPTDSATFSDYVIADQMRRLKYSGDTVGFWQKFGLEKIKPETAADLAWQYAESGAAVGAVFPARLREVYDRAHTAVPGQTWERARTAGLAIPQEQNLLTYEVAEEDEDKLFMAYCRDCCPNHHAVLTA